MFNYSIVCYRQNYNVSEEGTFQGQGYLMSKFHQDQMKRKKNQYILNVFGICVTWLVRRRQKGILVGFY